MLSLAIAGAEAISAVAALALVYSTLKPCRASSVPYLLGVPAGFGLMTIAFLANVVFYVADPPSGGLLLGAVFLLMQTYGILFLALTYARRTRLKFIGESVSIEFAIPSLITIVVVSNVLLSGSTTTFPNAVPQSMGLSLRVVMALAALYLLYETGRNWSLTKRASEGFVIGGFALLFIEQLGFIFVAILGELAAFVGYEGRIIGLLILIAATYVGIRKGDFTTGLKRLGLTAPAH